MVILKTHFLFGSFSSYGLSVITQKVDVQNVKGLTLYNLDKNSGVNKQTKTKKVWIANLSEAVWSANTAWFKKTHTLPSDGLHRLLCSCVFLPMDHSSEGSCRWSLRPRHHTAFSICTRANCFHHVPHTLQYNSCHRGQKKSLRRVLADGRAQVGPSSHLGRTQWIQFCL